jgi:hypothetical protein
MTPRARRGDAHGDEWLNPPIERSTPRRPRDRTATAAMSGAGDDEALEVRAARILRAMDSTPLEGIDASYYEHYAWELRHLVEDLLAERGSPRQVWLVWDCAYLAGVFSAEADAHAFRDDRVDQMTADYGRNPAWADAITVTPARIPGDAAASKGARS